MTASSSLPGHLIRRLHQVSTQVFSQRMKEEGHDLTPVQFATLDALYCQPGVDQASLAEAVGKDRATIGSVVDRLEQRGYLTRKVSSQDRRARILELTSEGELLIQAVLPLVKRLQEDILPGLSEAEYRQFVMLAAKAVRAAEQGF